MATTLLSLSLLLRLSTSYAEQSKSWEDKCTTIAIGKGATIDGSTVLTDTMVRTSF
jgi:hypothetical protein